MPLTYAENLGVEGAVYRIVEPDFLSGIQRKLLLMQQNGEMSRWKKAFIQRSIAHILRPPPVLGVSDLEKGMLAQQHRFDPTMQLNRDIMNLDGALIAEKGTRINPLNYRHFDETLIFINGDNAQQLRWATALFSTYQEKRQRYKIILVNGNINTSAKVLDHRVYFDQHGILCQRFNIQHTPTLVFQPKKNGIYQSTLLVKEVQIG